MKSPIFFESIFIKEESIPLLKLHFQRIQEVAKLMNANIQFDLDEFKEVILGGLSIRSRYSKIRISYKINKSQILFTDKMHSSLSQNEVQLDNTLDLCFYQKGFKEYDIYSRFKIENDFLYKDSIDFANSKNCQQSIILNSKNEIVETSISNIYLINSQGEIHTPKIDSGCINGCMRKLLMSKLKICEVTLYKTDIQNYEEVFLSNSIKGIQIVHQIHDKTLDTIKSKVIQKEFNKLLHS